MDIHVQYHVISFVWSWECHETMKILLNCSVNLLTFQLDALLTWGWRLEDLVYLTITLSVENLRYFYAHNLPYSGKFSWGPIFGDKWLSTKLDPRDKYDCTVYKGHDRMRPWKLKPRKLWRLVIRENWTPRKFPTIRYYENSFEHLWYL